MPPEYEKALISEYEHCKNTLLSFFAMPRNTKESKKAINTSLSACTTKQANIIIKELPTNFLAGVYIESNYLSKNIPAYTTVDLSRVSKTHLNKITRETIGHIGKFNEEIANGLKLRYGTLIAHNKLINDLKQKGWTAQTEKKLAALGLDRATINLIKQQSTTNKMIHILEQHGIRGGMHPYDVAKKLQPAIRSYFGPGGVFIDNTGKYRTEFVVDPDGNWKKVKKLITRPYHTTVKAYSHVIARSSMLRANRLGRIETLKQSGFVQKWVYISSLSANMCARCGAMHGAILDNPYEFAGGLHPMCACLGPQPVWKPETGLRNHSAEYYENQKNQWFWKTYRTREYNKTLPKEARIPNYNFLPPSELTPMPDAAQMREIRAKLLS
ncbi:hypothetical protein DRN97_06270 [Methanosarcinales archaeon]|nr:MAG: hypothetical protein DRN97_06270 [Methanosarcinales archaeon]